MQKVKILIVFFSFAILLLISFQHISLAYAESGCEQADWGLPLEGTPTVNSPFNSTSHYGTDYKAEDGDNVLAVADGVVLKNGVNLKKLNSPDPRSALMIKGWGRYVVLRHNDGSTTLYAHLIEDSTAHLKEGDPVTKGTIIGKADSTGGVTGSHLHLEYTSDAMWWRKLSRKDPHPCILGCKPEDILTIFGSETITTNKSNVSYTISGCSSGVEWTMSGKGATITQAGLLTTTGIACGSLTITASCPACSTTATKSVRVTDGGSVWINYTYAQDLQGAYGACYAQYGCSAESYIDMFGGFHCVVITGNFKYNILAACMGPGSISYPPGYSTSGGACCGGGMTDAIRQMWTYRWQCQ